MDSSKTYSEKPHVAIFDPVKPTAFRARQDHQFAPDVRAWGVPLAIGLGLLLLSLIALADEALRVRFLFSYLVGYTFILSIALGCMFFVMINHITKAEWAVVLRRIPETLMWSLPLLAILSIPILLGAHDLYHWTHEYLYDPADPRYDPLVAGKRAYLNMPFFLIRIAIYFAVWIYLAYRLYTLSLSQDLHQDPMIPVKQRQVSAWGLVAFSLTLSFASFDFLMSTDPHWFSTIFPVYFFAGSFLGALATITLIALFYRNSGILVNAITKEHFHDLGKFMFAFVVFWAYISFSQYMLIWYANIPEETLWYRHRSEYGWETVSLVLTLGHFVIPFFVLISRTAKRFLPLLGFMSVWILVFHFIDLYWIVFPVASHYFTFHIIDVSVWLGMIGLFIAIFMLQARRHAIVPYRDPRFERSLHFENI